MCSNIKIMGHVMLLFFLWNPFFISNIKDLKISHAITDGLKIHYYYI
jgi:hypothetical protein